MGNKKMELLSAYMQHQNEEPKLKSLLRFMGLAHILDKYLDIKLGDCGLTRTQRRILSFMLYANDFTTQTELSKRSLVSMDTINKAVDNLEKKGFIQSRRSRKDRRVRQVILTGKGIELLESLLPQRYQTFSQIMSCFTDRELEVFLENITRLQNHINELSENQFATNAEF